MRSVLSLAQRNERARKTSRACARALSLSLSAGSLRALSQAALERVVSFLRVEFYSA